MTRAAAGLLGPAPGLHGQRTDLAGSPSGRVEPGTHLGASGGRMISRLCPPVRSLAVAYPDLVHPVALAEQRVGAQLKSLYALVVTPDLLLPEKRRLRKILHQHLLHLALYLLALLP